MAKADLTSGRAHELLEYCQETGNFFWREKSADDTPNNRQRNAWNSLRAGKPARNSTHGYVGIRIDGKLYLAHRVAWLMAHGTWPNGIIDHINGITADNRLCNLRDTTPAMNAENRRRPRRGMVSGLAGAQWHKQLSKWQASIMVGGVRTHLGVFDTPNAAHETYLAAKRRLHKGCTI